VIDLQRLTDILWKPFLPVVRSGSPVYFSFSTEFLREVFRSEGVESTVPLKTVCEAARGLFVLYRDEAFLMDNALAAGQSGFSPAIILVCQQVLAVEEMVDEANGFSENAYFPRLRKLMSDELPLLSQNPFPFDDFESIWRTLATEVRSVSGGSEGSITFRFGETGINKARALPLSQGLLTLEDLRVIVAEVGLQRLRDGQPEEVWRLLRRVRNRLGRRGQRLIGLGLFRDRVISQISGYVLKGAQLERPAKQQSTEDIFELGVYKDSTDWLADEYRLFLNVPNRGEQILDADRIESELSRHLARKEGLVLPFGELRDHWICSRRPLVVAPGDVMLVLGDANGIELVLRQLAAMGVPVSPPVTRPIGDALGRFVAEVGVPHACPIELVVREGAIAGQSRRVAAQVEWLGGVSVDERRTRFLREFLPDAARFGDSEFPLRELVAVDGHVISFDTLVKQLAQTTEDLSVEIDFGSGRHAQLSVAIRRLLGDERPGYFVDKSGRLPVPVSGRVSGAEAAIVGFREERLILDGGIPLALSVELINDLRKNEGRSISLKEAEGIVTRLRKSSLPQGVRTTLELLLSKPARASDAVIAAIARAPHVN